MKRRQPLVCIEAECEKRAITRGWCSMHYARWQRHGDTSVVLQDTSNRIYSDPLTRFMAKVDKTEGGCWNWLASKHDGYGMFDGGKAHRWSYEHFRGAIPNGLVLDHLCRNRSCVNPDHLDPVTNRENILRGEGPPAQNSRRTHCKYGHKLSGDNLKVYVRPDTNKPTRVCLPCRRTDARPWTGQGFQICADEDGLVLMRGQSNRAVAVLTAQQFHHFLAHVKRGDFDEVAS